MKTDDFSKRFSVGLALESASEEYERLFSEYSRFIDNLYFSPPFGDRFHGRTKVAAQFRDPQMTERFWDILHVASAAGIKLEAVFNTHLLLPGDLEYSKSEFDKRHVHLDKVCVQDAYLETVRKIYPECKIVHSVNCMPDNRNAIIHTATQYDEYVVGRQYIRDADLFEQIELTKCRCVLLLNNGCSHICGGCAEEQHCLKVFETDMKTHSPQEIYAMQSILPYEIHEKVIDLSNISLLKISSRNADVRYIRECLDSYINNTAYDLVKKSTDYYLLWSRLAWLTKYFSEFHYHEIKKYKEDKYAGALKNEQFRILK